MRGDELLAEHTVRSERFSSARASLEAIDRRLAGYPLYRAYLGLWGPFPDEVVLDHLCGPGHDLTGFAMFSGAKRVVGVDASAKNLSLCAHRLSLHRIEPRRVELIEVSDRDPAIPLRDGAVDYVHSVGRLDHTPDPAPILGELLRVLKPGGRAGVMVYNRDSVRFHLSAGSEDPFPIAYRPSDWLDICRDAGFEAQFLGGYFSSDELSALEGLREQGLADDRLPEEHRRFVRGLSLDASGYPLHDGHTAGGGGCFLLRKPESDQALPGSAVRPSSSSAAAETNGQIASA